jgi:sec-independent protein translocase protein TatA
MNPSIFLIGTPGPVEIIIIVLIILLLFGGRKIPELMRGLWQGMKEFKKASKGEDSDDTKEPVEEKKK